jgi:hypothetical protein
MKDLRQTLEDLGDRFEPPSNGFTDYLRRGEKRRKHRRHLLVFTLSTLAVAAGAITAIEAFNGTTQKALAGIPSFKAAATVATTDTQHPCPALYRTDNNDDSTNPYIPVLSASSGPAGSIVTISGPLPVLDEAGTYVGPGDPDIVVYWNLDVNHWTSTTPSVSGSPVQQLGTQQVTGGACNFQIKVTIPSVAPGTYPIQLLGEWSGATGTTTGPFPPANFQVTVG